MDGLHHDMQEAEMEILNRQTLGQLEQDVGSEMLPVVIGVFLDEVGRQREQLRLLLAEGRIEELGRLAHSLKSSCGSYGAEISREQAATLEAACRQGQADQLASQVEGLFTSLEAVLALLATYR
jgi:HPt (histidine-containing phosphotransfer) domain-containing protein